MLPSAFVLGLAAFVAMVFTRSRPSPPDFRKERRSAARALTLAVAVQAVHFAEETATGLNERLGELLGVGGIPLLLFVAFNVMWLAIWVASIPGLRSGRAVAFFAAWFLAVAGVFNGLLHPILALAAGGYFPGVLTSTFIGAVSAWLGIRLLRATRPASAPPLPLDPADSRSSDVDTWDP